MKLLRYRLNNEVKPGILDLENKIRNASTLVDDWNNKTINIDNILIPIKRSIKQTSGSRIVYKI